MHAYKPIPGRRIRFAVVGCGRISKNNIEALKQHALEVGVAAVCDINPAPLAAAQAATGAKYYARYEDLLEKADIDAVELSTPSCEASIGFFGTERGGS